jgi:predicted enzyme related to lactoylglutathione lyase
MNTGVSTVVFPVSDLASAKAVFTGLLGVEPAQDAPYYVGFRVAGQDIGLDPNGHARGMTGATPFWEVDDIADTSAALTAAGAALVEASHDVGGGLLIAMLKDADGNMIGLRQTP